MKTLCDEFKAANPRERARERFALECTELLAGLCCWRGNRDRLTMALGSHSVVDHLLSGTNLSVRDLADACALMGYEIHVTAERITK